MSSTQLEPASIRMYPMEGKPEFVSIEAYRIGDFLIHRPVWVNHANEVVEVKHTGRLMEEPEARERRVWAISSAISGWRIMFAPSLPAARKIAQALKQERHDWHKDTHSYTTVDREYMARFRATLQQEKLTFM